MLKLLRAGTPNFLDSELKCASLVNHESFREWIYVFEQEDHEKLLNAQLFYFICFCTSIQMFRTRLYHWRWAYSLLPWENNRIAFFVQLPMLRKQLSPLS